MTTTSPRLRTDGKKPPQNPKVLGRRPGDTLTGGVASFVGVHAESVK